MTAKNASHGIERLKMLCCCANAPKTKTPDHAIGDMWKGMTIQWHPSQVVTHLLPISFIRLEYQKSTQENAKKIANALVGLWTTSICASLAKDPIEETTRRFGLLRRLHVVQWKRMLKLGLRDRAVDIYNVGALVGIVALHNGLGMLLHKADGRVR